MNMKTMADSEVWTGDGLKRERDGGWGGGGGDGYSFD